MGSCLSPILADIFVGCLESQISSFIRNSSHVFLRYVDDCFVLLSSACDIDHFLCVLNSLHPSITYTAEVESNDVLNFLDVKCSRRSDGSVKTSVCRKPTFTGLYSSFYSFTPRSYKVNLVKTLTSRAYKICTPDTLESELCFIRNVLTDNGYPPFFIDRHMQVRQPVLKPLGPEKKPVHVRVPFIGDKAASFLQRSLRQCFRTYPAANPIVLYKTRRIPHASPKDRLSVWLQDRIIYFFAFTCGCKYVGRTERRLADRIREHVPQWLSNDLKCPPRSTRIPSSAITRHLQVCSCSPDVARSHFFVLHPTSTFYEFWKL